MTSFFRKTKRAVITNNPATFEASSAEDDRAFVATPKTEQEKALLVDALKDHYVFSALSTADVLQVIHRMKKHTARPGEVVIKEGDEGDTFYVLFSGTADIIVGGQKVGDYRAGQSFGELALLYSAKRAATIKCTTASVLWSVDIKTFHRLVIRTQQSCAQGRLGFLRKVPLMQGLDMASLQKIADALQQVTFAEGHRIITEGEHGDDFFIIESGEVKCTHRKPGGGEQHLLTLKRGDYFGEMALMLDEPRHANVVATQKTGCFRISRHDFVRLFGSLQEMLQQQMRIRILKSVPLLSHLEDDVLDKLADAMRIQLFRPGKYVVKEGEEGSRFYIINDGSAKVTKNVLDPATRRKTGEQEVGILRTQDFFGERALINDEPRAANIIATEQLECLVLDRASFRTWLADVDEVKKKRKAKAAAQVAARPAARDLQRLRTLGTGTFGRVSLVVHGPTNKVYALKAMQKEQIVQSHQERNIMNEKNLLLACSHPFVLNLTATYQDRDCIYMLMEIVQGGELWSLIYEKVAETKALRVGGFGGFGPKAAQFFAACVIEAFSHVHGHGIAYRDLKPENLLLDSNGYVKVIDFGFAKIVPWEDAKGFHDKSYTICGTPEYLAPEIIQSKGHDQAVDLWALGCLVYELLVGRTPFADDRQPEIFRKILAAQKALDGDRLWPRGFPADGKDLVKALLKTSPAYRIGMGKSSVADVKAHSWFAKARFDWAGLSDNTVKAPYVPAIKDPLDTSHFDPYDENEPVARYTGSQSSFAAWSESGEDVFPPQKS
jgi:cGMP-dependent protein kinase|mmetsp:Transcript_22401/g.70192  ORF Transcript_22401/g.70192 Transcript_22401/m.70192 type:complete len:779 (+) Transcript_22401:256-2592(+)